MKFTIDNVVTWGKQLLERYPGLREFRLSEATMPGWVYGIEINTLEELMRLMDVTGKSLIIWNNGTSRDITIYDGHIE